MTLISTIQADMAAILADTSTGLAISVTYTSTPSGEAVAFATTMILQAASYDTFSDDRQISDLKVGYLAQSELDDNSLDEPIAAAEGVTGDTVAFTGPSGSSETWTVIGKPYYDHRMDAWKLLLQKAGRFYSGVKY